MEQFKNKKRLPIKLSNFESLKKNLPNSKIALRDENLVKITEVKNLSKPTCTKHLGPLFDPPGPPEPPVKFKLLCKHVN